MARETLAEELKTALDELRMQMLGLQVLFGFQFQGLFQPGFNSLTTVPRAFDAVGLLSLSVALTLLTSIPCQHRIVEEGESTQRLFKAAKRTANIALFPLAIGIGCGILVSTAATFGLRFSLTGGAFAVLAALVMWYGLARILRHSVFGSRSNEMERAETPLHSKIEQMLTEARVILPGAQALLGFQLIVMLSPAFNELAPQTRDLHVSALFCNILSIILLICPAAVHRMTFEGNDDPRMHTIGSALVAVALAPLAVSIALEFYVALLRLFDNSALAASGSVGIFALMAGFWYAVPFGIRRRLHRC